MITFRIYFTFFVKKKSVQKLKQCREHKNCQLQNAVYLVLSGGRGREGGVSNRMITMQLQFAKWRNKDNNSMFAFMRKTYLVLGIYSIRQKFSFINLTHEKSSWHLNLWGILIKQIGKSKMSMMMEISRWDNEKFVFKKWFSIRQICFCKNKVANFLCRCLF